MAHELIAYLGVEKPLVAWVAVDLLVAGADAIAEVDVAVQGQRPKGAPHLPDEVEVPLPFAHRDQPIFVFELSGWHLDAGFERENQWFGQKAQFGQGADVAQAGVRAGFGERGVGKGLVEIGNLQAEV